MVYTMKDDEFFFIIGSYSGEYCRLLKPTKLIICNGSVSQLPVYQSICKSCYGISSTYCLFEFCTNKLHKFCGGP